MLLYIHIPFCDSRCYYCSFNTYADKFHLKKAYMLSLETQLDYELVRYDLKPHSIESVFIGGGTPSCVNVTLYEAIFEKLKPYLTSDVEITTEANPNSASKEWLEGIFGLGVNRVSFGVQSFNDEKLKLLGRSHSSTMAKEALNSAYEVGFKNISLDLIYGLRGDTKELLLKDIDSAFSFNINHLSAYELSIEEGSVYAKKAYMKKENLALAKWVIKEIQKRGFIHYEISNFGIYQSRHNRGYWEYKEYIGLGSGAVGKLKSSRLYPTKDIEEYIKNPLLITTEELSSEDEKLERLFLGFRSNVGVKASLLNEAELKKAYILVQEKRLEFREATFFNNNYLLSDEIALYIYY